MNSLLLYIAAIALMGFGCLQIFDGAGQGFAFAGAGLVAFILGAAASHIEHTRRSK